MTSHQLGTSGSPRPAVSSAARPAVAGLSPSRAERLRAVLRRDVDSGRLPGVVALVARRGAEHVEVIGAQSFDGAPMRRDSIFRLASMTKPITAVAAMILVEECRLRLDDPVDEWLPELRDRRVLRALDGPLDDTVPATRSITLRDLLTFRSGYGEVLFSAPGCPMHRALVEARLPLAEWLFDGTPDEFMKRLGALPLAHQPGERWLYHMSADILGVLIARASGSSFGAFLRERVLGPLGMKDTGFGVADAKLDRLTVCYRTDPSSGQVAVHDDARGGLFTQARVFESGGGGMVSTVDDMLAFGRMMLNQGAYGRERILSRPSVVLMTTDQLTPEQKAASPFFPHFWDTYGWGLGLSVVTRRSELARGPGCFGWDGTFGTSFYVDPSEALVGILMSQRVPDAFAMPAIVGDFWTTAYQSIDD